VAPSYAYLSAQRLRQQLLQSARTYFQDHGIAVLAKPGDTPASPGLDGLPSLLGMPEVTFPVGFVTRVTDSGDLSGQVDINGSSTSYNGSEGRGGSGSPASDSRQQQPAVQQQRVQPVSNTLIALPGDDAFVIAAADAYQRQTTHHLRRPPLASAGSSGGGGGGGSN